MYLAWEQRRMSGFRPDQKQTMPKRDHKRCSRCEEWLSLEEFGLNAKADPYGHSLGRNSWCKRCSVRATQEWRKSRLKKVV
jgi:hypothetical protein